LLLFLSLIWSWLVCLCCIWKFSFRRSFCGKLLFCAIICINVPSFCFLFGVSRRECILIMWWLNAATLCSMGWYERKMVFVSVVVFLQNMSVSMLDGFTIMSRSRKLIHPLFSSVGLSSIYVCMYLVYECIDEVRLCFLVSYKIKISST
jgi:hypothetical protein